MVCFELKEVSSDLKCVLLSELHIHILIRYQLTRMGVSFGSRIDEKGCKLTSAGAAICQSFSHLCGVHINHRGPQLTVILRANSVVISQAITQIAQ